MVIYRILVYTYTIIVYYNDTPPPRIIDRHILAGDSSIPAKNSFALGEDIPLY